MVFSYLPGFLGGMEQSSAPPLPGPECSHLRSTLSPPDGVAWWPMLGSCPAHVGWSLIFPDPQILSPLNFGDRCEGANDPWLHPGEPRGLALEWGPLIIHWDLGGSDEISTLRAQCGL